jgi:hypothetical protein
LEKSTALPSFDSASIAGTESIDLMMSDPAPFTEEISGMKAKMFLAWITEKVVL